MTSARHLIDQVRRMRPCRDTSVRTFRDAQAKETYTVRLRSRQGLTKPDADERSSESGHEQVQPRHPDRPASREPLVAATTENFWSLLRHGTSSWAVLVRLLVLFFCLAALGGAALCLLWLLGVQVDIGPVQFNAGSEQAPPALP